MDRRRFIATVGVASAAVRRHALEPDWAHAEPSAGPGPSVPDQVDDRFLDALTTVNNLQVPGTAVGLPGADRFAGQPSGPGPERPAAGQRVREPARAALPRRRPARTAADPADRPRGAAEPQRSVRHRQPGQPTRHLVRDQRPGSGLRPAGRRRPAGHGRRPGRRTRRSCGGPARALAEGGVHTPNHRWEICKALAHLYHLWPSRLLLARINDWLGEGIDQDGEGEYSERSPNYAAEVTNRSLLIVARYANKPRLRDNVRRNLD